MQTKHVKNIKCEPPASNYKHLHVTCIKNTYSAYQIGSRCCLEEKNNLTFWIICALKQFLHSQEMCFTFIILSAISDTYIDARRTSRSLSHLHSLLLLSRTLLRRWLTTKHESIERIVLLHSQQHRWRFNIRYIAFHLWLDCVHLFSDWSPFAPPGFRMDRGNVAVVFLGQIVVMTLQNNTISCERAFRQSAYMW